MSENAMWAFDKYKKIEQYKSSDTTGKGHKTCRSSINRQLLYAIYNIVLSQHHHTPG